MRIKIIFILFLIFNNNAHARPVSYAESWTWMTKNNGVMNSTHIHYSPTFFYSLGYRGEYLKEKKYSVHTFQYNYLIKRWNKKHSQANLYTKKGLGLLRTDFENYESKYKYAGYFGISTDWETRRYFTAYENRYFHSGNINSYFTQKIKLGIAPYIGDYGDLHTWLMIEINNYPESADVLTITPLVRLFYQTHLIEIGSNDKNKFLFNYTIRF